MATLLLIRHGQASYGEVDYDRLSERGRDQARALGRFLAGQRLDALHVGPLRRQVDTAALAVAAGGLPAPTTHAELAEYPAFDIVRHFMPKLAESNDNLGANAAFHTVIDKWSRDEWQHAEVERVGAFAARVRAGLERIVREVRSGGRVAVVTSAGPIGVAVGLVFGATEHRMVRTSTVIRNASITELKLRTDDPSWERISLLTFNSTSHLSDEQQTDY